MIRCKKAPASRAATRGLNVRSLSFQDARIGEVARRVVEHARPLVRHILAVAAVAWAAYGLTALKWSGIVVVCLYLGTATILYFAQRSMMYFPETIHTAPAQAGLPLVAWHVAPRDDKPVIIYFHGNGGALRYRVGRFRKLISDGIGIVAVEYRGYGGSGGSPTEPGLIVDGEAAYAFAAAHYQTQQLVLWGESLGSAIAVRLAAERPVARVILETPFTSAVAVADLRYWYLPIRLLMKDQYRSDEFIGHVTAPVLILHGVHDHIVPFAMGMRMFELTKAPKHIVRFLDGDHENLDANGALHAVAQFLAGDLDEPPAPPRH
jgi:uncharacterized protein